jgi:23S rRNA (adenine2030-N6)-methyltransferase
MNYRHAFHAGSFADVMKHALLVRALCHLRAKDKPFRVVDTHAGIGLYDLAGEEAGRTLEWQAGVGRLDEPFAAGVETLLRPYRAVLASTRRRHGAAAYPGSPQIVRELLRPQDRAILVELHPADAALLAQRFKAVGNVKVIELDGWTALHAVIPPKERRGLVLVDPPYEDRGELSRLAPETARAVTKWPTGIYMVWYPIKDAVEADRALAALAQAVPRPVLRLELLIDRPDDPERLNGCGLAVVNPPWILEAEANLILPALAERLARSTYGAYRNEWMGHAGAGAARTRNARQ